MWEGSVVDATKDSVMNVVIEVDSAKYALPFLKYVINPLHFNSISD